MGIVLRSGWRSLCDTSRYHAQLDTMLNTSRFSCLRDGDPDEAPVQEKRNVDNHAERNSREVNPYADGPRVS